MVGRNTTYIMIVNQDTHCHVCRYSRKLIWLAVEPANHNPVVTYHYVCCGPKSRFGFIMKVTVVFFFRYANNCSYGLRNRKCTNGHNSDSSSVSAWRSLQWQEVYSLWKIHYKYTMICLSVLLSTFKK